MATDIVIVSAARTAVGSFNGAFGNTPAHDLGAVAIKAALDPYFRHIDLRVEDPGFRLEELPPGLATSVTLALSSTHPQTRSNAIARFTDAAPQYRTRRLWQSVGNIDSARELAACVKGGVTFVSGPAVCAPAADPVGGIAAAFAALPYDPAHPSTSPASRGRPRGEAGREVPPLQGPVGGTRE